MATDHLVHVTLNRSYNLNEAKVFLFFFFILLLLFLLLQFVTLFQRREYQITERQFAQKLVVAVLYILKQFLRNVCLRFSVQQITCTHTHIHTYSSKISNFRIKLSETECFIFFSFSKNTITK